MKQLFMQFIKEEDGATMVEYAILVALISVVAIVTIVAVGGEVDSAFKAVDAKLKDPSGTGGA